MAGYTLRSGAPQPGLLGRRRERRDDAQAGIGSAIFPRTVKLKDFPWNGWLTVGVPERASAAWNPVGGFADPAGRLLWLALGDPGLLPRPRTAPGGSPIA